MDFPICAGRIGTGYELSTPSRMGRRFFPFLRPQPPAIAHPSAIAALLLRATLTDDGHCCICTLWLVWYPLPWTRKVGRKRGDQWVMGRHRETKSFLVVRTMSKRSVKIQFTDDVRTRLVTGRTVCHSPKIVFFLMEPQS